MNQEDYRIQYEQLSDDELLPILADRQHLVDDAAVALDLEVRRRGVKAEQPKWTRRSGLDERGYSMQDYDWYQLLYNKRQFMNKNRYMLVITPFAVALIAASTVFKNFELVGVILVFAALVWALLVVIYGIALTMRFAGFKCPQCGHRFGTDAECWSCAFPRHPTS